ncbi:MAG: cysteine rich repeat-containing protein [Pseudomonadota bacterium]
MKKLFIAATAAFAATSTIAIGNEGEIEALRKYCKPDIERLCPKVEFGEGRIKECLHQHRKEISVGCAEALKKLREG